MDNVLPATYNRNRVTVTFFWMAFLSWSLQYPTPWTQTKHMRKGKEEIMLTPPKKPGCKKTPSHIADDFVKFLDQPENPKTL